jgi:nicotinamidase-related amidase
MNELPVPDFYDPTHAGRHDYAPDPAALLAAAAAWRDRHAIPRAGDDDRSVHLVLIDVQKDFCFPEGSLFVGGRSGRGAIDDTDRTARFLYRNLHRITEVSCTLDTHYPFQIFSPAFWSDAAGRPPAPHREVTAAQLRAGELRPAPGMARLFAGGDDAWLRRQVLDYCQRLEAAGRYRLYLWPPHCLAGSPGHALAGVIQEARLFHAWTRGAAARIEVKGEEPLTEYYSALGPEVEQTHDGRPLAAPHTDFLDHLLAADMVIVAGQAASHCVRATVDDLLGRIEPELARKVYLLEDCMSAVAVPDGDGGFVFDFTGEAEAALRRFAAAGMNVVRSTTPLESWDSL